jgi:hypothetical protein
MPVPSGDVGDTIALAVAVVGAAVVEGVAAATAVGPTTATGPATSAGAYGPNGVSDSDTIGWLSATVPTASAAPV